MARKTCRASMLAAAPQSPGSELATVPGKWIPVSERIPEKGQAVLVYRPKAHEGGDSDVRIAVYGRHNFEHGFGCYWEPSHWMPLPAAPQEVGDA
ncbi:Eaa1 [Klebsiella pneumoniae subsp. rhinoscleromatis]|nr:Eaa1 [Klebsiella pneumoniae subsp. rhinoscleromatis]